MPLKALSAQAPCEALLVGIHDRLSKCVQCASTQTGE